MTHAIPGIPGSWFRASVKPPLKIALPISFVFALILVMMPNQFRSEAKLLPGENRSGQGLNQLAALATGLGINGLNQDPDAVYLDILSSRWLHERLLTTPFEFHDRSWRFGTPVLRKSTLRSFLNVGSMDRSVDASRGLLQVRRDLKTRTITVEVETRSPELSQCIVRKAVALLGEFLLSGAQTRGGLKAQFAQARLEEAQRNMSAVEQHLKQFLQNNRNYIVSTDPEVRVEGARLEAELRMRQQLVLTLATLHEQALMEEKNNIPLLNVLDEGNLPEEKSRPHRAIMVIGCFAFVYMVDWLRRVRYLLLAMTTKVSD